VMYGHGDPSQMLSINAHDFGRLLDSLRGHSPIVEVEVEGSTQRCVIKTLQRNPIDGSLLHVDFQKVHPTEKITINVPVVIRGSAEGVKEGGMLDHLMREVPVRATIDRIPERFEIDVTPLGLGQSVRVSDLAAEGLTFEVPLESAVVAVLVPRKLAAAQMEAAAAAAAPAEGAAPDESKEPEVIKQKTDKEEPAADAKEGKKPEKPEKKEKKEKK